MMRQIKLLLIIQLFLSCSETTTLESSKPQTPEDLIAHSDEFKRELITVTDGVHVAVGYALANSILIEGEKTNIIIDTTGSEETAREVKDLFDAINPNPVETIIYTHNHADHTYGATVFAEGSNPDIYAHSTTEIYLSRVIGILRPIISSRSNRMFGNALPKEQVENNGIGPFLEIGRDGRKPGLLIQQKHLQIKLNLMQLVIKLSYFMHRVKQMISYLCGYQKKKLYFQVIIFIRLFPIYILLEVLLIEILSDGSIVWI